MTVDLSVVVITWNQEGFLRTCLESVMGNPVKSNVELVVVDNGSTDGTREYLSTLGGVTTILNDENLGVARARNQGIEAAQGRYVFHLDDDAKVHPGCLDRLRTFMDENEDVGLAGCRVLNPDGTLQPNARRFYTLSAILARRTPLGKTAWGRKVSQRHLMMDWDHQTTRYVDWVCGAAFCMRRSTIDRIGGFYDGYFFGFEDVEWAFRVWKHGQRVAYVYDTVVTHCYQRSSRRLTSKRGIQHLASLFKFWLRNGISRPIPH
ncbi:glycosyltransferase [Candidatus Fermentibacteria bacterium]|nr:glycosyltransferase [Candidatus Fermentibacteria bacterium]